MGMEWIDEKGAEVVRKIHVAAYRDRGTLSRAADRLLEVARVARSLVAAYQTADAAALQAAIDRLAEALDYDPRPPRGGDSGGDRP